MAISIDAEKPLNKIQYPFLIKILRKLEIKGIFLNLIDGTSIKNTKLTLYLMVKDRTFSPWDEEQDKDVCSLHCTRDSNLGDCTRKRNERHPGKEELKCSLLTDIMILYIKKS